MQSEGGVVKCLVCVHQPTSSVENPRHAGKEELQLSNIKFADEGKCQQSASENNYVVVINTRRWLGFVPQCADRPVSAASF